MTAEELLNKLQTDFIPRETHPETWKLIDAVLVVAHSEGKAEGAEQRGTCEWKEDGYDAWDTECGECFAFSEGGPAENDTRFCCYCGKPIKAVPFVDPYEGDFEADDLQEVPSVLAPTKGEP